MREPGPSAGLNYEQQILELEQQLVQRQNPEGATPPPCPSGGGGVGGSEQQSVTEAQRSVELEREQEVREGFKAKHPRNWNTWILSSNFLMKS
ncbi:unnamed protein product [Boreogadus saida]